MRTTHRSMRTTHGRGSRSHGCIRAETPVCALFGGISQCRGVLPERQTPAPYCGGQGGEQHGQSLVLDLDLCGFVREPIGGPPHPMISQCGRRIPTSRVRSNRGQCCRGGCHGAASRRAPLRLTSGQPNRAPDSVSAWQYAARRILPMLCQSAFESANERHRRPFENDSVSLIGSVQLAFAPTADKLLDIAHGGVAIAFTTQYSWLIWRYKASRCIHCLNTLSR